LREIVIKYLPPEKVRAQTAPEGHKTRSDKEDDLFGKAILTFAKENRDTYKHMTGALASGDHKTAHRIAHTLKSSAGYLGRKELSEAAFSLEQSLHGDPPVYTPEQLSALEQELETALRDFRPLVNQAASEKPDAVQIDGESLKTLLSELEPFLQKGDFGALDYLEKLQGIAGMEELAERVDDYDFEGALQVLQTLK
jgi:HPt (histidine-containing phosphotransfer) domain-containing protein